MHVVIFGNQDLAIDSIPIRLLPRLRQQFPQRHFTVLNPHEEWDIPEQILVIDTVIGICKVTIFTDLSSFTKTPRNTCHDFDAYTNLLFLKKLGNIKTVTVIGVPPHIQEDEAYTDVSKYLSTITPHFS